MVTAKIIRSCWLARPCDCECKKAPAKKTVGLLKCDACRQHRRCQYETGTSARPSDSSRTNSMSVYSVACAVTRAALSSGCKSHPAIAPAGSNRSSHGGNEVAEAFD